MAASIPFDEASSVPIAHLEVEGLRAHPLREHLEQVGRLAGAFASSFSSEGVARVAGRLHDLGKFSATFQTMIRRENGFKAHIEGDASGPRDHSTAGAILSRQLDHLDGDVRMALMFAIAGHHAGLADFEQLRRRLAQPELLESAIRGGYSRTEAAAEHAERPQWLPAPRSDDEKRALEFWIRMVFSCLCDADFLDTERFFDEGRSQLRESWPSIEELAARLGRHVDELEARASASVVNTVRREIRAAALQASSSPRGIFTLTVPTGGGKTLTAMEFALQHAKTHGLARVIVAVPLTAILEQNAEVYRRALGDDAVLEHHSAVDVDDPRRETPRTRVAAENWDVPIVVTTTVQLFESIFANRTSRARKLHNVAGSVIVLDEAQALPVPLLHTILDGLRTLVRDYGVTVVFSTATQPAFARRAHFPQGLDEMREIVPASLRCFDRLKRVRVEWPDWAPVEYAQLAEQVGEHEDVLVIVHRRSDARELALLLDERTGASSLHLSALMCPAHRTRVLRELKERRSRHQPLRVVSTQLIEAGVDVDFPVVYRAFGGLDSIAQAAGRCNREGLRDEGVLRVFVAPTSPPKGLPRSALGVTRSMVREGPLSIDDPRSFQRFFEQLYPVQDLDAKELQATRANFNYRTVAGAFRMVENDWSAPVVVPWGDFATLRAQLNSQGANRRLYRALQPLTVNVARKSLDRWLGTGVATEVEGVAFIEPGALQYDERFGLRVDLEGVQTAESLVIDE
ncbi:MAG: CRISPR-associated endonuclease Cas3'' [Myxococcaceae bacterium]